MRKLLPLIAGGILLIAGGALIYYYQMSTEKDEQPQKALSFTVFTFANDNESMSVLKKYYVGDKNYVIEPVGTLHNSAWLFDTFSHERKIIIASSLNNLTDAIRLGKRYSADIIAYDIEHWDKTPESEKHDPTLSIQKGADIVHAAGFRYGITPDAQYLLENYKAIDWTKVDFLGMQLQKFSGETAQFATYTKQISDFVRTANPQTEVFVQLSFRFADANRIVEAIGSVERSVDGFIIAYLPSSDTNSCVPRCTPEALDKVLARVSAA